jgi:hypothetical protein
MVIQCQIVVDDGQMAAIHSFASVPRVGEWITIAESGEPMNFIVEYLEHVAEGALSAEAAAATQIHATRRKKI